MNTVRILVDTSVWIDFFRGRPTSEVTRLKAIVGRQEVVIGDLILAELLQGIRYDSDLRWVEARLAPFEIVPLVSESIARQSAVTICINLDLFFCSGLRSRITAMNIPLLWDSRCSDPDF